MYLLKHVILFSTLNFFSPELMLLGFISLLLTATSSIIANICISSKFYNSAFAPCTRSEVNEDNENNASHERKLLTAFGFPYLSRRVLSSLNENTCKQAHDPFYVFYSLFWTVSLKFSLTCISLIFQNKFVLQDYEPFVSYEGLEQLHRFIFVMAITHISYSCLTMLLAVVKVRLQH